jgi:hypothetical protein
MVDSMSCSGWRVNSATGVRRVCFALSWSRRAIVLVLIDFVVAMLLRLVLDAHQDHAKESVRHLFGQL